MLSEEKNKPPEGLRDKLRSQFGMGKPQKNEDTLPPKAHFSIWYLLLAMLFFSYLQPFIFTAKVETIPYSQFKQYIAEGKMITLIIGPENIKGTLTGSPDKQVTTIRVDDPGLVKELDDLKVSYSGQHENKFLIGMFSWIFPLAIFFLIWRFAMKKMGPGMGGYVFFQEQGQDFC